MALLCAFMCFSIATTRIPAWLATSQEQGAQSVLHAPLSESRSYVQRLGAGSPSALLSWGPTLPAWHDAAGTGSWVLSSPQVWMIVYGLQELMNGRQPLPQGSRCCPLTQNFCCSCLLRQVLSFFHNPNPSWNLSGHCHDQFSSANNPRKAASLFI